MLLLSGVSAESIARVHCKLNQISVDMLAIFAEIGRLRIALPFDASAGGVDQLLIKPCRHDIFVIRRLRPVEDRICRRTLLRLAGQTADEKQYRGAKRKPFHRAAIFPPRDLRVQPNQLTACAGVV